MSFGETCSCPQCIVKLLIQIYPVKICCVRVGQWHEDDLNTIPIASCLWQVEAGSRTVLAIMGEEEMVNNVTGSLKLLWGAQPHCEGIALQCHSASSRGQRFLVAGRVLACKLVTTFKKKKKRPKEQGKTRHVPTPENTPSAICFPFILCLSRLVGL